MADMKIGNVSKIMSYDEIRRRYRPARTLGASEEVQMAHDAQLVESNAYSLIQHALEMGQGFLPEFLGYTALQGISQNGLIRACIETVADDMTRAWIKLNTAGETNDNDLIQQIDAELKRLNAQAVFHLVAEQVGYEGGTFIFLDTGAEGADLLTPLPITEASAELKNGGLKRLTVVDPIDVFPGDYNSTDPLKPDYYKPSTWWVLGRRVHASRLIRFVANEVPMLLKPAYNFLGLPQAQILWDYVLHFNECRVASQRLLTKFSLTVFKTNIENILYSAGGTEQLDKRVKLFARNRDNDGIAVIDNNTEDFVKLETPLSGVIDIVRQGLEFLAALNRTPAVKLLGISPSGFNATGESDIRNYYDHIKSQQEKVFRTGLEKILKAVQISLLGSVRDGLSFEFNELGADDKSAVVNLQKTKTDIAGSLIDRGIISAEEARAQLIKDPESGYNDLSAEMQGEATAGDIEYPDFSGNGEEDQSGMIDYPVLSGGDTTDEKQEGEVVYPALGENAEEEKQSEGIEFPEFDGGKSESAEIEFPQFEENKPEKVEYPDLSGGTAEEEQAEVEYPVFGNEEINETEDKVEYPDLSGDEIDNEDIEFPDFNGAETEEPVRKIKYPDLTDRLKEKESGEVEYPVFTDDEAEDDETEDERDVKIEFPTLGNEEPVEPEKKIKYPDLTDRMEEQESEKVEYPVLNDEDEIEFPNLNGGE